MPRRSSRLSLSRCEDRLTPAGWLDPTWGEAGIATLTAPPANGGGAAIAFLPDGGAVVGRTDGGTHPANVTKLLPDGRPDPAFGTAGTTTLAAGGVGVVAVAPGPDGTVYVLVNRLPTSPGGGIFYSGELYPGDAELIRLTAAGQLDPTFDGDGVAEIGAESNFAWPTGLAVGADGRAVVSSGAAATFALVGADGGFDPAAGGLVAIPLPAGLAFDTGFHPSSTRVEFTADGGLMAVVEGYGAYQPDAWTNRVTVVSRLTAAGGLDPTYGSGGQVVLADPRQVYEVTPTADGGATVLVSQSSPPPGGWCGTRGPDTPVAVTRLDPAGQPVGTFAGDGSAELGLAGSTWFLGDVVPLADGRTAVLAVGDWDWRGDSQLRVRVLGADGRPDPAVADGGWLAVSLPTGFTQWWGRSMTTTALADGRLAVLGNHDTYTTQTAAFQVAVLDFTAATPAGGTVAEPTPYQRPGELPVTPWEPVLPPSEVRVPAQVITNCDAPVPDADFWTVTSHDPDAELVGYVCDYQPTKYLTPADPAATSILPGGCVLPPADDTLVRVVTEGPRVSLVDAASGTVLPAFAPFEASYTGTLNAVRVDIDGDGTAELVVSPNDGGGPVVAVFRADGTEVGRFFGIDDPNFRGGVRLAAGDVNNDGTADLVVTAGDGGGPRVALFDGRTLGASSKRLVADFFAFEEAQRGGAFAAFADGTLVFGAGPGGGPRVRGVDARGLLAAGVGSLDQLPDTARRFDRFVGDPADRGGLELDVRPAAAGGVELTAAVGAAAPQVLAPLDGTVFLGAAVDPLTLERVSVG